VNVPKQLRGKRVVLALLTGVRDARGGRRGVGLRATWRDRL